MSMQFGATMWFTEYSMSPSEIAVALEECGFESLWASEHSHLPVPENSSDGELRKEQADVMDPFLTLTAAAMSTKTLRLGTGICLVNQRDPIQTAKLCRLDRSAFRRTVPVRHRQWLARRRDAKPRYGYRHTP
jgi:alkanesulfonate monooxygenase SsuD/methylene tetrahydromethanopterin reductase-like flavin-dependent oxidoreductase (luciferase family)